jgi:hypothetical protein
MKTSRHTVPYVGQPSSIWPFAAWTGSPTWRMVSVTFATIGALLFALAAYTPWVVGVTETGDTLPVNSLAGFPFVSIFPGATGAGFAGLFIDYFWCAWTISGVLLVPLLWRGVTSRRHVISPVLFAVWTGITFLVTCMLGAALLLQAPGTRLAQYRFVRIEPSWGLAVTVAALLLMLPAAASINNLPSAPLGASPAELSRVRGLLLRASATICTLGILLWSLGFFALPWVSSQCSDTAFSLTYRNAGVCQAMDAAEALGYALDYSVFPYSKFNIVGNIMLATYLLLAFGAGLSLWVMWRPFAQPRYARWPVMWLSLAIAAAVATQHGVDAVTTIAPFRGSGTPRSWHADVGIPLTYIGLALIGFGIAMRERVWANNH